MIKLKGETDMIIINSYAFKGKKLLIGVINPNDDEYIFRIRDRHNKLLHESKPIGSLVAARCKGFEYLNMDWENER